MRSPAGALMCVRVGPDAPPTARFGPAPSPLAGSVAEGRRNPRDLKLEEKRIELVSALAQMERKREELSSQSQKKTGG